MPNSIGRFSSFPVVTSGVLELLQQIQSFQRGKSMKAKFWDVKARKSVEAEVTDCVKFENGRFAFKAVTKDGRNLTRFVSADDAAKFGKPCCKKSCKK